MDRELFMGVDVGGTSVKMGIVDRGGNVLARTEFRHADLQGGMTVMDGIVSGIRTFAAEQGISIQDLSGIGVDAAGCIDSVTGSVADNGGNVPGWSYTQVCRILSSEFGIPSSLANDGNCAVLGESWTGAARGYTDVVGVIIGTGIGGGIITGGRLLEGSRGFAGEIGHTPLHAGGIPCVCGLDGCFERYASTGALTKAAAEHDPEMASGRVLFEAAARGNETALDLLSGWIDELAHGIAGLVHIFDPQLVLIGGGVSAQQELLIDPLRERVLSLVMPDFADGLELRAATLGNDAGLVGAVRYLIGRLESN